MADSEQCSQFAIVHRYTRDIVSIIFLIQRCALVARCQPRDIATHLTESIDFEGQPTDLVRSHLNGARELAHSVDDRSHELHTGE